MQLLGTIFIKIHTKLKCLTKILYHFYYYVILLQFSSTDPLTMHVNKKQYLKLSSNVKEAILKHKEAYEKRLQEDFKQVRIAFY